MTTGMIINIILILANAGFAVVNYRKANYKAAMLSSAAFGWALALTIVTLTL